IAARAGLNFTTDAEPGLSRCRCGQGFRIIDPTTPSVSEATRQRVKDLVIPPAWTDVWISRDPEGHLQATGYDDRGRKQYLYHERWDDAVREWKFASLVEFGHALKAIRTKVDADLRRHRPELERSSALAVHLIDRTGARVGNREYTRDNETYGITTLQKRHAQIGSTYVRLDYIGKSRTERELYIRSRRIARHMQKLASSPQDQLFAYADRSHWRDLTNDHVNDYLKSVAGEVATAKRFRTWRGTRQAFRHMVEGLNRGIEPKRLLRSAMRTAADDLGNTVAVCRAHYVHPAVLKMTSAHAAEYETSQDIEPQLLAYLEGK
ncbi:MAG: DNA topoisomerase IB, partial [Planctomycetota bacterium]